MPYVTCVDNRYIGEHDCRLYHCGDMTMRRACCVADALARKANVLRVAMTQSHPAYALWRDAFGCLTDVERVEVGALRPVYDHGPAGFDAVPYAATGGTAP